MHFFLLLAAVLSSEGSRLEMEGRFIDAGRTYFEEKDVAGEVRIVSRFIEESLYSGDASHAFTLMAGLETFPLAEGCMDFWYARLAWSCGLARYAIESLESISGSPWLEARARGMASAYRGRHREALNSFIESLLLASSVRQKFYSCLDVSFALLSLGRYDEACELAANLQQSFPGEGLPLMARALALHGKGEFSRAMMMLQDLSTSADYSQITRNYATALLENLE